MTKKLHFFIVTLLVVSCFKIQAQTGAVWTSTTAGTLDGVPFTVTGFNNSSITTGNLSGSDYSSGPLSNSQELLQYAENSSSWTVTFDSPITDLRIYLWFWRSNGTGEYVFTSNPTIESGSGFTVSSNTVTVTSSFGSGIVELPGNTTTLTVTHSGGSSSLQGLTFGLPSTLSIEDNDFENSVTLYPNPFIKDLSLEFVKNSFQNVHIEVFDATGRLVNEEYHSSPDTISVTVNGNSGVYFIRLTSEEGATLVKKLIKL